jgi:hypothetical protein
MTDQQQGLAGECLVAADLLKQGYNVHFAAAGSRTDLFAEAGGKLLRVQVKSCRKHRVHQHGRGSVYKFQLANAHMKLISTAEVDIVALVALDTNQIAYLPAKICTQKSLKLWPTDSTSKYQHKQISQFPFTKALEAVVENTL